jgi:predicted outer membrane protein
MKARSLVIAIALGVVPRVAMTQPAALGSDDIRVVTYLHEVDRLEIYVGRLAVQHGTPAVRDLGKALVDDHTAADNRLIAYARKHGMETIPVEAPIDPDHEPLADAQDQLHSLTGKAFDDAFVEVMPDVLDAEQQTIEDAIATVDDPELEQILRDVDGAKRAHVIAIGNLESTDGKAV